jgi:hypothetical protein
MDGIEFIWDEVKTPPLRITGLLALSRLWRLVFAAQFHNSIFLLLVIVF